ncbi:Histidinol dehydrogenase [Pelotomaculum schinkii]|uniref:Histidinol dehydrogenase n=1 Tax=Pelotomaculum schinkii TaxID=78350 RepID=A0A4Y7R723_9FIRM|nr:Histidinol dehydrogenase [Pelotomaculum schinkii]TEB16140.1 Histidinol dehydrogenase [Pelotomaculum sp. FP]
MEPLIKIFEADEPVLEKILRRKALDQSATAAVVAEVLSAVRGDGDAAVCALTARFGGPELRPDQLRVNDEEIKAAYGLVEENFLSSLRLAIKNITAYHQKQQANSWFKTDENGAILGQLVRPLRRVGIYVPGGKASYPSSVLMNAIPAKVAGVREIAMVSPPASDGSMNPYTLVAAAEVGISEIYKAGGAQAVAALAYGTASIPRVDKITGPGNIYVTLAKQQVYGQVDIDMLAGPSEVLIIADETADPGYVAADLLSQAEHDERASAILLTPSRELAGKVQEQVAGQAGRLGRYEIITHSLADYGAIVITGDIDQAFDLANQAAPEHLELMLAEPFRWLFKVENAGAVFMGHYSPEPVGDYLAGPNHILPTGGTARFYSPLGVDAFLKRTSLIAYNEPALEQVGADVINLAGVEGLSAHANAVRIRMKNCSKERGGFKQLQNTKLRED